MFKDVDMDKMDGNIGSHLLKIMRYDWWYGGNEVWVWLYEWNDE